MAASCSFNDLDLSGSGIVFFNNDLSITKLGHVDGGTLSSITETPCDVNAATTMSMAGGQTSSIANNRQLINLNGAIFTGRSSVSAPLRLCTPLARSSNFARSTASWAHLACTRPILLRSPSTRRRRLPGLQGRR
jgi:hypothetical protein